jgi:hypothetical protein
MISIKPILKSQYHAGLAMLEQAIDRCPDSLWISRDHPNRFWHVAYHAIYVTHMYLQHDEAAFRPWEDHREDYQFLGPLPWPPHRLPNIGEPYTKAQILEYLHACKSMVDAAVDILNLDAPESGFWWYKMPKLEHQIVNLRHLEHHTAQLADRLRQHAGVGIDWIGAKPA